jgi:GNAT superfamily N-acetyltransferase
MIVRALEPGDRIDWQPLWDGYNHFYERVLPPAITESTWARFLDPAEPAFAAVAEVNGRLAGLVHYLFHRSTAMIEDICYLEDLFTAPNARGMGVGRALIAHVYEQAAKAGVSRVYWQTHEDNPARKLYDQVATRTPFRVYERDLV